MWDLCVDEGERPQSSQVSCVKLSVCHIHNDAQ